MCLRRWGEIRMENGEGQVMQSLQSMGKGSGQLENRHKAIKVYIDSTIWNC